LTQGDVGGKRREAEREEKIETQATKCILTNQDMKMGPDTDVYQK